ncbi:beta-ketoacyl synthase N-terminal-like domain-containing protein [Dietzia sp. 179-F 9C3 NHS]|uniref:beta-ketoacyl synthase N-terminal-like domain-containing protein n=1 Tax=Dietzia sp. 179-F 9C3 NHS TaxID=3374295 RepID=UPI0038793D76
MNRPVDPRLAHHESDIAVIGMSCRLPGAPDVEALWGLLLEQREGVIRTDREAARRDGAPADLVDHPGFVPTGSDLGPIDDVDLAAFGFTRHEARYLDPQHRVFAEEVWHALDDAGHGHGAGVDRVGLFAGCSPSAYLHHSFRQSFDPSGGTDPANAMQIALGTMPDYLATGIAYRMNLTGPAQTVLTACSTSLVAVHLAAESLRSGESDIAVAGGVTVRVPASRGYVHIPDGPFSVDGHTRSYGSGASGAVFTQGAGAVVLRRYGDAVRSGDRVRAVIRGSAVNNDGAAKAGFVVPGVDGHATVIAEALAGAGLEPRDIGYVEGHGTGTRMGDPVEVAALNRVFGKSERPWCRLGSIKSNIGHTEAAAGVAGLIKAVLAVERGVIPASLHCAEPNPDLGLDGSAFRCADAATDWGPGRPRIAGVSSLGFGGTNAHVVVAQSERTPVTESDPRPQLWLLGAASRAALDGLISTAQAAACATSGGGSALAVPDLAHSLSRSEGPRRFRAALVVNGTDGAVLETITSSESDETRVPAVVAACPGGGAQRTGMAEDLYRTEPAARALIDQLASVAEEIVGDDLRRVCCPSAAGLSPADADDPLLGLPALFATTVAGGRLWLRGGSRPDAWIGHSSGEYAAAVLSGALDATETMRLVARRAKALSTLEPGGMARVRRGAEAISDLLERFPGVEIAARNSPRSAVLAGSATVIDRVVDELGDDATRVRISVPGHSTHVVSAIPELRAAATGLATRDPQGTLYSCLTAGPITAAHVGDPDHWADHLRRSVRFDETLGRLADDLRGPFVLVDLGPGSVIAALTRECAPPGLEKIIALAEDDGSVRREGVLRGLGQLHAAGRDVHVDELVQGRRGAHPLPRYPFDRTRAWTEPEDPTPVATPSELRRRALRDRLAPSAADHVPENAIVWRAQGPALTALAGLRAVIRDALESGGPLVVTVDAREGDPEATAAVLAALPSVRAEHPELALAGIVVHSGDPHAAGCALAADLHRHGPTRWPTTVHLSGSSWQDEVVVDHPVSTAPDTPQGQASPRVVVIGGLGTVGREIAASFVAAGSPVTLTTRRELCDVPPGLVPRGASVATWDGSDAAALAGVLSDSQGSGPLIVVQCTGVVGKESFATVQESGAEVLQAHDRARVRVWGALEQAVVDLGEEAPDVIVAMSSLASVSGGLGLAAYAVSCRAVELRCETTAPAQRTRRVAVAWDGWRTTGAEDAAFARNLLRHALDPEYASTLLRRIVAGPARGTVIASRRPLTIEGVDVDQATGSETPRRAFAASLSDGPGAVEAQPWLDRLCALWADALGLDREEVGPESDFFALGGQSLAATRLLGALRDELGLDLRLRDLLDDPTPGAVAGMAVLDPGHEVDRAGTSRTPDSFRDHVGPAPLTPVQRAYLLGREDDYGVGGAACHSFVEFRSRSLDPERFEAAFRTLVQRHPMLRTVVELDGMHELDIRPEDFRLDVTDLSHLDDPDTALQRWRDRLSMRRAPASRWPLVCPYLAITADAVHVGWSIDVLVCDADSFGLLHSEMGVIYRGEDPGPAPLRTFADHVRAGAASRDASCNRQDEDRRWWADRVGVLPAAPEVTGEAVAPEQVPVGGFARHRWALGPELSQAVVRASARRRTTPTALLLTAYAHMLRELSGRSEFSVMLTTFGRPPEMAGVIGEFTELSLVGLHTSADSHASLDSVGASLFEALDRSSVSGIDVLAMRSAQEGRRFSAPVVFTSTLGGEDESGFDDDWSGELVGGISQTPQVVLDHQVYRWGGNIIAQWDYLATAVDAERLERAVGVYEETVRTLVEDAPSPEAVSAEGDEGGAGRPGVDRADDPAAILLDLVRGSWADVLGLNPADVAPEAEFLALGGDSLTAVRTVAGLREIGVTVPVADVLNGVSPEEIAREATAAGWRIGDAEPPQLVRAEPGRPFPLTPLQQAYWVGAQGGWQLSNDAAHFVVDFFDPLCDPTRLRAAARRLIDHQPMLRAVVTEDGYQRVLDPGDPRLAADPVEIVDLTGCADEEVSRAIADTRSAWEVDGPDPEQWPTFRIRAHLLPGGGARVHVVAALVFVDGWSFYLFFDQLLTFHDEPNAYFRAPEVSFADHVATLESSSRSPAARRALENWRRRLPELPQAPLVPVRAVPDRVRRMERRAFRLDADTAAAFTARCRAARVTPTAVFGAAYSHALAEWCAQERFLLTVLYFNRPPISGDIDRVLGAFSSTVLVDIAVPDSSDPAVHAGSFGDAVGRSLDDSAVDGVDVARELSRYRGTRGLVSPVVFTSTLGFSDPTAQSVTRRIDPTDVWERVRTPQVLVDLQVASEHDQIVCNVDCPEGVIDPDDHQRLVDRVQDFVAAVLEDRVLEHGDWPRHGRDQDGSTGERSLAELTSRSPGDVGDDARPRPLRAAGEATLAHVREAVTSQLGSTPADSTDFFSAGGDSLGLVRVLVALRRRTGLAVAPAEAVVDPTIERIAALVDEQRDADGPEGPVEAEGSGRSAALAAVRKLDPETHLVPMSGPRGRSVYLLHPSGGDVLCYSDLVVELPDWRVLALPDPRYFDTPMPDDLSLVVAAYADLLEAAHRGQDHPLVLGGWSMGGTVAHDVAVELHGRGVRVGGVIMIDSTTPDRIRRIAGLAPGEVDAEVALRYLRSVQAFAGTGSQGRAAEDIAEEALRLGMAGAADPTDRGDVLATQLRAAGLTATDARRRLEVFTSHLAGLAEHHARSLKGTGVPVLLIRADETSPVNSGVGMGVDDAPGSKDLGWGTALGSSARIIGVDAHHYSVLRSPAVERIGSAIREFLTDLHRSDTVGIKAVGADVDGRGPG